VWERSHLLSHTREQTKIVNLSKIPYTGFTCYIIKIFHGPKKDQVTAQVMAPNQGECIIVLEAMTQVPLEELAAHTVCLETIAKMNSNSLSIQRIHETLVAVWFGSLLSV
jgi:hypothetical protein